jgi:peptidoglycan/xylan/chitin deacetylase (PgdA/CDA1 family)
MGLKTIKVATLTTSKRLGLFAAMGRSRWRTGRLLILGYHGISLDDEHLWNPALYMTQDALRRRLELLVRNDCSVLSLGDAVARLAANDLPPRAVAITFDDGYYDFLARAYPVVREFDVPVTVYQTSYYCRSSRPIFDVACSYLLWKGAAQPLEGRRFTGTPGLLDLRTAERRAAVCFRIRQEARRSGLSTEEKDDLLERLAASLSVETAAIRRQRLLQVMNPTELRQIVQDGVDLQLHTHRHRMPRNRELFVREIVDNRDFLAAVGQPSAEHFCYPSGDYDECFLPWLAELGVHSATTCDTGLATRGTRTLLLPRLVDSSALTDVEFEGWLHGLSHVLPRRPIHRAIPLE